MTEIDQQPHPIQDPSVVLDLRDLYTEATQNLDERSHEYKKQVGAVALLASEYGYTIDDILDKPGEVSDAPNGYKSAEMLPGYHSQIHLTQFKGEIKPLKDRNEFVTTPVEELVTDSGQTIRLIDLRPFMSKQLQSSGPQTEAAKEALSEDIYRDIKALADGAPRSKMVDGLKIGVWYTHASSKVRGYWMPVKDDMNSDGIMTIARLADCADGIHHERKLYRQLFGKEVRL